MEKRLAEAQLFDRFLNALQRILVPNGRSVNLGSYFPTMSD